MTKTKLKSEVAKTQSKMQKKCNTMKKECEILRRRNMVRKEQQKRDHDFVYLFKEMFPEDYKKVVEECKKRFPRNQERIL